MGWKFRKRIKIAPGVALNLSKGRPSVTLGGSPASINVGRGAKLTTSIPGTGLSHTRALGVKGRAQPDDQDEAPAPRPAKGWGERLMTWAIFLAMLAGIFWWFR